MENYEEWLQSVPPEFRGDSLWKIKAYRLALFVGEIGWYDVSKLMRDKRTLKLSDQLYRSLGSISANLAEGYSRGSGKDKARFYEYSLGSARESRDWYYKGRHILGEEVANHRLALITQIIRLLLTMIPQQRKNTIRENTVLYESEPEPDFKLLDTLLAKIPLT
ncbi:MAG: hypothetical protein MAG431_01940 [Chloroflexi bacterium]|nr:hypothetical protein [Chloroflexota bacterium]